MKQYFSYKSSQGILIPLLAGIVLGILAPFGSSNFEPVFRFMYWIGMTFAGALGAMLSGKMIDIYAPELLTLFQANIRSLGATAAVSPFVFGLHANTTGFSIVLTLFYIWIVAIVITAFGMLAAKANVAPEVSLKTPPLLDRLPPKFREAELYAISSEDHYVRIHSSVGEHMILMRLSDAQDLAAPLTGLKPHRSWWVAEAGIDKIIRSQGKLHIHLKSGVNVPVSREGAKRVRAANWI